MNEIEFKIFKPGPEPKLTRNKVVYTLYITSIVIVFLANKYLEDGVLLKIGVFGVMLSNILIIYFKITQHAKSEPLNGIISGKLIFRSKEISIENCVYSLDDIKKIEFTILDYLDKWELPARGDLAPARKNGTSNTCEITLINGQKIKVNFQLILKDEFKRMRELLILYYSENKLHFLRLIDHLGIDKYEDIQEFKKTLPSKTTS